MTWGACTATIHELCVTVAAGVLSSLAQAAQQFTVKGNARSQWLLACGSMDWWRCSARAPSLMTT